MQIYFEEAKKRYLGLLNSGNYKEEVKKVKDETREKYGEFLRDYQLRVLELIEENQDKRSKLIVLPTGAGKTEIFISYIKVNKDKFNKIFILVPRLELEKQVKERFLKYGFKEDEIGVINSRKIDLKKINVVSLSSLLTKKEERRKIFFENITNSLLVLDEYHNYGAKKANELLEKILSSPFKEKLLFTATPFRNDKVDLFKYTNVIISSLDLKTLIREKYLSDYEIKDLDIRISGANYKKEIEYLFEEVEKERNKKISEKGNSLLSLIVSKLINFIKDEKLTCIFVTKKVIAENLTKLLNQNNIKAVAFYENIKNREEVFEKIKKGEYQAVVAVDLFTEGIDIPFISQLVLIRPFKSLTKFIQTLGRGLRKAENKDKLKVIAVNFLLDKNKYISGVLRDIAPSYLAQVSYFLALKQNKKEFALIKRKLNNIIKNEDITISSDFTSYFSKFFIDKEKKLLALNVNKFLLKKENEILFISEEGIKRYENKENVFKDLFHENISYSFLKKMEKMINKKPSVFQLNFLSKLIKKNNDYNLNFKNDNSFYVSCSISFLRLLDILKLLKELNKNIIFTEKFLDIELYDLEGNLLFKNDTYSLNIPYALNVVGEKEIYVNKTLYDYLIENNYSKNEALAFSCSYKVDNYFIYAKKDISLVLNEIYVKHKFFPILNSKRITSFLQENKNCSFVKYDSFLKSYYII